MTCEYDIIYARLALTDATFNLLFWAALASLWQGAQTASRGWWLAGGILTGLCWNTKYHGFFPIVLVGVWILATTLFQKNATGPRPTRRAFLGAAFIAAAMFIPWIVAVQSTVGYESVLKGHLSHSWGTGEWIVTSPRVLAFSLGQWTTPILLLCAAIGAIVSITKRARQGVFIVWICLAFGVTTLFYMSFPRLLLPTIPALCLLGAYGIDTCARWVPRSLDRVLFATLISAVTWWNLMASSESLSLETTSYRDAAAYIQSTNIPAITQMKKNYYFYEHRPSYEIRWHSFQELDRLIRRNEVQIAFDPTIYKFPEAVAWLERYRSKLRLAREFEISMFEPLFYQGFDPTVGIETLPRSVAPDVPGKAKIKVYYLSTRGF